MSAKKEEKEKKSRSLFFSEQIDYEKGTTISLKCSPNVCTILDFISSNGIILFVCYEIELNSPFFRR